MKIIPVVCQRCGAPLDVADESVRFVTCAHCSTPLEIVREATQSHSRILEQIQAVTEDHSRRLEVIELQNDLEKLDQDWERDRARLCGRNETTGKINDLPAEGQLMGGMIAILCGLAFPFIFFKWEVMHVLANIVPVALAFWMGIRMIREGIWIQAAFEKKRDHYEFIRASLIARIQEAKHG
ncbi:MAG: hypothetical protein JNN17_01620 [Verrucomicrobiaceae bacterium]|nr:hypothetical protein [Verrucomicrobiaceae bacterium]